MQQNRQASMGIGAAVLTVASSGGKFPRNRRVNPSLNLLDWFTLQGINISHLGKRKIIFKMPFLGDMLVPWRAICFFLEWINLLAYIRDLHVKGCSWADDVLKTNDSI